MKRCLLAILIASAFLAISPISAQAPASAPQDERALLALIKEIQQQQTEIAANQIKLEAKLAEVAEAVRIARIYAARSR